MFERVLDVRDEARKQPFVFQWKPVLRENTARVVLGWFEAPREGNYSYGSVTRVCVYV